MTINRAEEEWKKAIELEPNFVDAHHNLAVCYYEKKEYSKALEEWEIVKRLTPNYPNIDKNLKLIEDYRQRLLIEISQSEAHPAAPQPARNAYTVKMYDTLWRIAKKELGDPLRWEEIYNANKAIIGDRPILRLGQVLVMPLDYQPAPPEAEVSQPNTARH